MRVGIDARLSYHQPAGISRYTTHLIEELAQLDRETTYTVFQHRKQREPLAHAPNFRRRTLFTPVHTRVEQKMLAAELSFHSLDLLHSTDFIPPLHSSIPSVITVHDLAFLRWPHFLTESHAAYYSQIDQAVRHAQHIIVPSENTKKRCSWSTRRFSQKNQRYLRGRGFPLLPPIESRMPGGSAGQVRHPGKIYFFRQHD